MITSRLSGASRKNASIESTPADGTNTEWLRSLSGKVARAGAVVLLGGAGVLEFRIRVAQSHLRADLLPSFWSQAGILLSRETFLTVPLDARLDPARVPSTNAIHTCAFDDYDDPRRYPNIAVINFAATGSAFVDHARRLESQRSAVDLPRLVVSWLAFAWGAGASGNPLLDGAGVPSAALVETAFGIGGLELTPGIASSASCPEAIWQAALWWHDYYEKTASAAVAGTARAAKRAADPLRPDSVVPFGAVATRQRAAAVLEDSESAPSPKKPRAPARRRR